MEVTLTLTLEEVNGIIGTLAMLPFGQVNALLTKVRDQAITQVQASQVEQPEVLTPEQASE